MKSWCCDVAGCGQVMRRQVDVFEVHIEWQEPAISGDNTRVKKKEYDICPDHRALFEAWLRGEAAIVMESATATREAGAG